MRVRSVGHKNGFLGLVFTSEVEGCQFRLKYKMNVFKISLTSVAYVPVIAQKGNFYN